jgi:hypothetical protein
MSSTKQKPQPDAEQFERFKQAARELGCDEDKERFERKLGQLATAQKRPAKKMKARDAR